MPRWARPSASTASAPSTPSVCRPSVRASTAAAFAARPAGRPPSTTIAIRSGISTDDTAGDTVVDVMRRRVLTRSGQHYRRRTSFGTMPAMPNFDALDTALLRLLQDDARRTNRDLAAAVHVAPSTCLERVRGLRERGVITGYRAEVDLAAMGRPVQAMIAVRIRPPSRAVIEGFRRFVCGLPEVLSVFVCSGENDF